MNQTLADAIRKEGVSEAGIDRIQRALWDAELAVQWDRDRWEANMKRRAVEARQSEADAARALCIPYNGKIAKCQVGVYRGGWWQGQCMNGAKFVRRDRDDNVMVVCGTHARTAKWSLSRVTNRRGEVVVPEVEAEYNPPTGEDK